MSLFMNNRVIFGIQYTVNHGNALHRKLNNYSRWSDTTEISLCHGKCTLHILQYISDGYSVNKHLWCPSELYLSICLSFSLSFFPSPSLCRCEWRQDQLDLWLRALSNTHTAPTPALILTPVWDWGHSNTHIRTVAASEKEIKKKS